MEPVGILEMLLNSCIPDEGIITHYYVIYCTLLEVSELNTAPYVYLTSGLPHRNSTSPLQWIRGSLGERHNIQRETYSRREAFLTYKSVNCNDGVKIHLFLDLIHLFLSLVNLNKVTNTRRSKETKLLKTQIFCSWVFL